MQTISVVLDHRYARFFAPKPALRALRAYWSFYPSPFVLANSPKYQAWKEAVQEAALEGIPAEEVEGWDGRISPFAYNRVPAGLFRATWKAVQEELGVRFVVKRTPGPTVHRKPSTMAPATGKYEFHNTCTRAMLAALPYGGGLILAATGAGKTALAARMFSHVDGYCLFISDQINLMEQNQRDIEKWIGEKVGLVGGGKRDIRHVTVATIQTLQTMLRRRRMDEDTWEWFNGLSVVFIDEFHEQLNKRTKEFLDTAKPAAVYGLSGSLRLTVKATRLDAHSIGGPVIYQYTLEQGVKSGVLTEGIALQLLFPARYLGNNAGLAYARNVLDNPLKMKTIKALAKLFHEDNHSAILFADRKYHVRQLCEAAKPTPHRRVDGDIDKAIRRKHYAEFDAGKVRLLVSSRVTKKGISINRVDIGVDCAEQADPDDTQQKYGRLTRVHEDKRTLLYIDFATSGPKFHAATRANALRKLKVPVERRHVGTADEAITAVKEFLDKL